MKRNLIHALAALTFWGSAMVVWEMFSPRNAVTIEIIGHSCPGGVVLEKGILEGVTLPERLFWIHLQHPDGTQCLGFWESEEWRSRKPGKHTER